MKIFVILNIIVLIKCSVFLVKSKKIKNNFYKIESAYVRREKRNCTFGQYRFCNLDRRMLCNNCYLNRKIDADCYKLAQGGFIISLTICIVLFFIYCL